MVSSAKKGISRPACWSHSAQLVHMHAVHVRCPSSSPHLQEKPALTLCFGLLLAGHSSQRHCRAHSFSSPGQDSKINRTLGVQRMICKPSSWIPPPPEQGTCFPFDLKFRQTRTWFLPPYLTPSDLGNPKSNQVKLSLGDKVSSLKQKSPRRDEKPR